ncbi:ribonuclease Trv [Amylocarpus encephaloides]|uniref:Ribonuclease T2-like n=1 Tax=Amylocarpus encephaloides TaxID=45428 RepID=A0A9P7YCQ9_9HELO|nr:ribonuclease Trv [Amylocarpus encephaloides]
MRSSLFLSLALPAGIAASCNADNCLRALRATARLEAAQSFCATFTTASVTETSAIPSYAVAGCTGNVASRVSSACSCISTPSTTSTFVPSTSTSTSVATSTPTGFPTGPKDCLDPQLSCHNTTAVADLCCFNAPGGQLLQTQFWDTSPSTGPNNSWTIHGLWPDHCDGTYDANCDPSREFTNITAILEYYNKTDLLTYMNTYWKDYQGNDESFWEHEWGKHGTCISTLEPSCYGGGYKGQEEVVEYFEQTVGLFGGLDSYSILANAGILPSRSQTYTLLEIQSALTTFHSQPVTLGCSSGALDEIWYHFNVLGSVQTGSFIPAPPDGSKSDCPATGIKYLPKYQATPTSTGTGGGPTGTGVPYVGKGYLNAFTGDGGKKGCLISAGTWYTTGTCATYNAVTVGDGFTLTSSKGPCTVQGDDSFSCAAPNAAGTVFRALNGSLAYAGSSNFYAAAVPVGSVQQKVFTRVDAVPVSFVWQSL